MRLPVSSVVSAIVSRESQRETISFKYQGRKSTQDSDRRQKLGALAERNSRVPPIEARSVGSNAPLVSLACWNMDPIRVYGDQVVDS